MRKNMKFSTNGTALQKKHVILFFQLKHIQKIWLKKKPQAKITSKSKALRVSAFSLWYHLWQLIKIGANFLCNSLLHRNLGKLYLGKFFVDLLENLYKMRKIAYH